MVSHVVQSTKPLEEKDQLDRVIKIGKGSKKGGIKRNRRKKEESLASTNQLPITRYFSRNDESNRSHSGKRKFTKESPDEKKKMKVGKPD